MEYIVFLIYNVTFLSFVYITKSESKERLNLSKSGTRRQKSILEGHLLASEQTIITSERQSALETENV